MKSRRWIGHRIEGVLCKNEKKIFILLLLLFAFITIITNRYDGRDIEEKLEGFEDYPNYQVNQINLPTKGDVVLVKKLPDREYSIRNLKDGNVIITGYFYYEIRPQVEFSPDLYHTDMYGNTPENGNYWGDMRYGTVLLSINDEYIPTVSKTKEKPEAILSLLKDKEE